MAVIFVVEIVFGIALRHESKAGFQKKMEDNMSKYISDFAPWDKIQREVSVSPAVLRPYSASEGD